MSKNINVKKRNGRLQELDTNKINLCAERACENLAEVSASEVVLDAHVQFYDKITTSEIDKALIMSARQKLKKNQTTLTLQLDCYLEPYTKKFSVRVETVMRLIINTNYLSLKILKS